MKSTNLCKTAKQLVSDGKGILAADESTGTIGKRFKAIAVENNEPNRASWRELMFTADSMEQYISGVITYEETLYQSTRAGESFVDLLRGKGVIVGIKVDNSTRQMPFSDETFTEGLDGLRERLAEYYKQGARFTKWRAVIKISGDKLPTPNAIRVNASALALYAALAQEAGLVPIVEPEVLMDGDHSIERCYDVTEAVLQETFLELSYKKVGLSGMLLKPNMVISALNSGTGDAPERVAEMTVECLKNSVPPAVPGIAFLSGGQSSVQAIRNLNAINQYAARDFSGAGAPWSLTFSYGRALQADALAVWGGKDGNSPNAQETFIDIAKQTYLASRGEYQA